MFPAFDMNAPVASTFRARLDHNLAKVDCAVWPFARARRLGSGRGPEKAVVPDLAKSSPLPPVHHNILLTGPTRLGSPAGAAPALTVTDSTGPTLAGFPADLLPFATSRPGEAFAVRTSATLLGATMHQFRQTLKERPRRDL